MNIIFLDIDGVLNTFRFQDYQVKHHECDNWDAQFNFDPICMKNLKTLIDKTNAVIVISSTWRNTNNGLNDISNNLRLYGIEDRLFSTTPAHLNKSRGYEVKQWLNNFEGKVDNYVILDDCSNMDDLIDKLVLCNEYYGFTKNELEKALKILGGD